MTTKSDFAIRCWIEELPRSMQVAFWFYVVNVLVSLTAMAINVGFAPPTYSRPVMIVVGILMFALILGLWYKVFTGRNWARLLNAAIYAWGMYIMMASPISPEQHVLVGYASWLGAALQSIALIATFRADSNAWFRLKATRT